MKSVITLLLMMAAAFLVFEGCEKSFDPAISNTESDGSAWVEDVRAEDAGLADLETEPLESPGSIELADLATVAVGAKA